MKRTKRLWHPTYLSTKYKTQRIVDGKIEKTTTKDFLLNLLQTLCCKKKCRKKRRKMYEDWLSIQTKNVRFYSSIFCYTFFSYLPSYYLSKTFIQSGTVATPYLYNMIYKKNINTGFTVDYSLEQITYLHVLYLLLRNKI